MNAPLPAGWVEVHPDPENPNCVRYDYIHEGQCVGSVFLSVRGKYDGMDYNPKSLCPTATYRAAVIEIRGWIDHRANGNNARIS